VVLVELEEMCVGSDLGYRPSSFEEFGLAPIHPLFSDDPSNSEEDEKLKHKTDDFTGLCLMGKSSRHISDSDVSDDSSSEDLSF
jgi:hypothetical protein